MIDLAKVARVIYEAHGDEHKPDWDDRQVLDDVLCGELARAATREVLAQLMEPSEAVWVAGESKICGAYDCKCDVEAIWQAMLKYIMENEL